MTTPTDPSEPTPTLSPEDARVLDLLAEHGFDPDAVARMDDASRPRAEAIVRTLRLLDDYPVRDADDALVDATIARIRQHERLERERLRLVPAEGGPPRWRPRLADAFALAALVLIGFAIFQPMVHRVRQVSSQTTCAANLASVASAFGRYANDHDGALPQAPHPAVDGPLSWDRFPNFENLRQLVREGYCPAGNLNCPGHCGSGPAYAYRVIGSRQRAILILAPEMALLADRNPVIDHALLNGDVPVQEMVLSSPNHGGRGQQVLFGDGHVRWTTTPLIRGVRRDSDNLWLMQIDGAEDLRRGLIPTDPDDNFLSQ